MTIRGLEPSDVARWLAEGAIVLIDVREPHEFAVERIHGALLFPLSTFDPRMLPESNKRQIVFHCGTGVRSAKAILACEDAGLAHDSHIQGGLKAWKSAGLPTISIDPVTGKLREQR